MGTPLHVLIVDDSPEDATLVVRELRRGGYDPLHERVDTPEGLDAAFKSRPWDIVLVDFTMPRFSGRKALDMVKERDTDVPFIFVSGTIGEDAAVAAMKSGAHDYIMKGNLKRLLPAIDRELREAQERRKRRRAEENLQLMQAVSLAVAEAPDVHAALAVTLRLMAEAASCDAGQAWLPAADGDRLECSPAWYSGGPGFDAIREASQRMRIAPGFYLAGRVWQQKQPVWIADLRQQPAWPLAMPLHDAGFVAALGVPVVAAGEVVAVLELYLTDANAQYERLTQVATSMAAQLGTVIQRKQAEARLSYLAHYDVLTGLPNRVLFNDRLRQALVDAQRHGRLVGVAFVDLDRFKVVNDSLGHDVGDMLLNGVAQRLCACVRNGDTVARLSGDEFTIILADMRNVDDAARVANKIVEAFNAPFHIHDREVFASPSLGIALFPLDDRTAEGLLRDADVAMYRAKQQGGNSYQFYRTEMTYRAAEKMALETGLRRAIEREELLLKYQPKVDVASGIITGVEALIRWQPQRADLVSPDQFVPLAEEIGLIVPIGEWALNSACAQIRSWQDAGLPNVRVAVNLSARQLAQPMLPGTVARVLEANRVDPRWLELEITESLLMQNTRESVAMLEELSALGVRLVLDDFGTGYSSLSYLKRFPLHAIKIDQSFVRGMPDDKYDDAIASAIIVLAHKLGLHVIAEGVETRAQFDFLREHHCDEVQGYLFGTPFAADEAAAALRAGSLLRV